MAKKPIKVTEVVLRDAHQSLLATRMTMDEMRPILPDMDKLKAEAAKWATQEEDVLTYAMFPQVAPKFFDKRNAKKQGVDGDHVDYTNQSHPV